MNKINTIDHPKRNLKMEKQINFMMSDTDCTYKHCQMAKALVIRSMYQSISA